MPRTVPQTPVDQDQDLAVEVVITNHMGAVEVKAAALLDTAEVHMVEAAIVVGLVAVEVDKEVDHMAEDNRIMEVEVNRPVVVAVVAMVSNNNTKVNKVAILDSLALSYGSGEEKVRDGVSFRDTQLGVNLFLYLVMASSCQKNVPNMLQATHDHIEGCGVFSQTGRWLLVWLVEEGAAGHSLSAWLRCLANSPPSRAFDEFTYHARPSSYTF